MSDKTEQADTTSDANDGQSFEEAVHELRSIVQDLESGSLGLQESLAIFEEGTGLLRSCYGYLEAAEQKIELLTRISDDGTVTTESFDGQATVEKTEATRKKRTRKPKTKAKANAKSKPPEPPPAEPKPDPAPIPHDEVAPDADVRSLFD